MAKKVWGLIPAREGSKRIPHKNIKSFAGKPMIYWSIEAAKNTEKIDRVFVTTDSLRFSELAIEMGAESPFLRSEKASNDTATSEEVVVEFLQRMQDLGEDLPDCLALLQPTSPLRVAKEIDEAISDYFSKNAHSIIGVSPCRYNPQWANTLPENGSMDNFLQVDGKKRSQDLEQFYTLNGAIYLVNVQNFLREKKLYATDKIYAFKMDPIHSIDIDDELDFKIAEFLKIQQLEGKI